MHQATANGFMGQLLKRYLLLTIAFCFLTTAGHATSTSEYQKQLRQAVTALDSLAQADENESDAAFATRNAATIASVRVLLPANEYIESSSANFTVDNSWLQAELDTYKSAAPADRNELRQQIIERLEAIAERVQETEQPATTAQNNQELNNKLKEILQRPEYARKVKQESAIGRLLRELVRWLESLMPKPKPVNPSTAGFFSKIAQGFVLLLALLVLIFVGKMFLPRLLTNRTTKKKVKTGPRIVLGERLEPDQSANDLLAQAEALARSGDLRAAIRKAYIALLLELGERKIIALEQYKTNYDYLRAVQRVERLYPNVKQLTDSFERHWYGLAQATENDWQAFRSGYKQALAG